MQNVISTANPHFNRGTVAWLRRNGVTVACLGPDCTWQGDPYVVQSIEGTEPMSFGVESYNVEKYGWRDIAPKGATLVTPEQFALACQRAGCTYTRTVD